MQDFFILKTRICIVPMRTAAMATKMAVPVKNAILLRLIFTKISDEYLKKFEKFILGIDF